MAKFINKKEEVIQMELTAYGKHKFSRGDFSPSYYSFHDDDILYDSVYASPSGTALSAHGGFYEEQNSIVTRIKEMQRLELVTHFTSSMGASSEATTNITNTTFDNVNPANLKYFRSLGTSSPWDEHMPAWDIKCMETGMPFSGTYSYKALGIPTLTSSLQLEYSVSNGVFEDNNGDQVEIPIFTLEKEDKILIDIQEINTIFKSSGNFEVEVYKIKTDEQGSEDLVKVDFIGDNSKSSDMLKAQSTTEGFARYLNGDEELVGSHFPRMGPDYVEYYLSVRADDEIEFEKEPPGDTLYRSGKVVGPEEC